MDLYLEEMTKDLARKYFQKFQMDPALFIDERKFQPYVYNKAQSDATVDRYKKMGRVHLAVMMDGEPIGEVVLKDLDYYQQHCTMGISMRSDEYKNKGYGTKAEILTLRYAFNKLKMNTVLADSILKNTRSQHVLKKVGFVETHRDDTFVYYRCDKSDWTDPG